MPRPFPTILFRALLLGACLHGVAGCDSRPVMVDGMLEWEDASTPSDAREAVQTILVSKDPDYRRKAIGFLSDEPFGGEPVYRRYYRQFGLTDTDAGVRAAAVRALGDHGGPEDGAAIVPLLADKAVIVRLAVADALRKIKLSDEVRTKAQDGLINLLSDEDVDVRSMAADVLGHYPGERTARALMDALEDASFSVAWYAHRSLAAISGKDMEEHYDARQWGAWLASAKLGDTSGYLWEPYYRRPWTVQWGWQPWSYFYDPPALEAPRAKAIRDASSLEEVKKRAQQEEKKRRVRGEDAY